MSKKALFTRIAVVGTVVISVTAIGLSLTYRPGTTPTVGSSQGATPSPASSLTTTVEGKVDQPGLQPSSMTPEEFFKKHVDMGHTITWALSSNIETLLAKDSSGNVVESAIEPGFTMDKFNVLAKKYGIPTT